MYREYCKWFGGSSPSVIKGEEKLLQVHSIHVIVISSFDPFSLFHYVLLLTIFLSLAKMGNYP